MKLAPATIATAFFASTLVVSLFVSCGEKDDDKVAAPTPAPTVGLKKRPLTMNLKADCKGKPCF